MTEPIEYAFTNTGVFYTPNGNLFVVNAIATANAQALGNCIFITANAITIGNTTVFNTLNSTAWSGTANNATATSFNFGNSTVNSSINSTSLNFANSTVNAVVNTTIITIGNSTVNTALKSTVIAIGNSTVNTAVNSTVIAIGNSTVNTAVNSTVIVTGTSTVNATINSTAFSGTSNNALNLGGTAAASYALLTNIPAFAADADARAGTNTTIVMSPFETQVEHAKFTPGYLFGCILSTAGSSTAFAMTPGICVDSTANGVMNQSVNLTKTISTWAVGNNAGGLDTGTIAASTWYHVYVIKRTDTNVVDAVVSLSATAPTLPANYTIFRRVGSMKTDGSNHWTLFFQVGDTFLWDVPVLDVNGSGLSGTSALFTLTVPLGITVTAIVRYEIITTSGSFGMGFVSPLISVTSGGAGTYISITSAAAIAGNGEAEVIPNTSAQIRIFTNASGGTQTTYIGTQGWKDTRGKLA